MGVAFKSLFQDMAHTVVIFIKKHLLINQGDGRMERI